jgi:hypothetical protein
MVTVKNYHLRQGEDGKSFVTLELIGDIELVQSSNTGRFYATCRRCFIYSTFDEAAAKSLVGKQIPGSIERVECEPYQYTVPDTGELIMLAHTYTFQPEVLATKQANSSSRQLLGN